MKKLLTITILLAFGIVAHSQAFNASYTYDANGNRISATIIWLTSSLKSGIDTVTVQQLQTGNNEATTAQNENTVIPQKGYVQPTLDSVAGTAITIYPNPTHGLLLVKIDGFNETHGTIETQTINVYNIKGSNLSKTNVQSSFTTIDLQTQPTGTYIMVIQIGSLSKTYTIIKN